MAAAANINNQPLYTNRIRTTLYGARLALDDDGALIGPFALKLGLTTLGTTAHQIPAHGLTNLNAAAASTYVLDPPMVGVEKVLMQSSNGTSHNIITGTSLIKIISTWGSTMQRVCLQSSGDFIRLMGVSTGQWAVTGLTAGCCLTT